MKIVILDAYSTSNIGDAELVRLTIANVRARYGVAPLVLATDPNSFGEDCRYLAKPLSRFEWRSRHGASRVIWLLREVLTLCAAAIAPALPLQGRSQFARWAGRLLRSDWLAEVATANQFVAVGGGYLGDRYLRESLVSALLYRFGLSIGAGVETMPVSISSAKNPMLRLALRRTSGMSWRVRESVSENILASLSVRCTLVPDLAWLDAEESNTGTARNGIVVAPVGSTFYSSQTHQPKTWVALMSALKMLGENATIRLVPMHSYSEALGDGGDDAECMRIADMLIHEYSGLTVKVLKPKSYDEVRVAMAASQFAICERLHAALAATTTGTPVQIISYEPKHRGVMELAGLAQLCDPQNEALSVHSTKIMETALAQRAILEEELL